MSDNDTTNDTTGSTDTDNFTGSHGVSDIRVGGSTPLNLAVMRLMLT